VIQENLPEGMSLADLKDEHFNENLAELLSASGSADKIAVHNNELIQIMDPIYNLPPLNTHPLNYRSQFFAPSKHFLGSYYDTYYFNIMAVWFMTFVLYLSLYYDLLNRLVRLLGNLSISKKVAKKS
jgi:hypothetical protein